MASIAGKTKTLECISCHQTFVGSLYADARRAQCPQCKKTSKKVGASNPQPTPVIHHAPIVGQPQIVSDKPMKVLLIRNRQEIEGHVVMESGEVIERIPTEYKTIKNELDYLSVSKIDTYQQCPAKFHRQYMSPENPGEDNGNIFTWFGSILHEVVEYTERTHAENGLTLNPLVLFDEAWKKRCLTDFGMYREARELILDYFVRYPVGSGFRPLMKDGKAAVEIEYRGPLGEVPVFGNMFDFIGEIDAETAIIKDYKSNRHPYTQYQLEDSLQLQVYEIIARQMFPQYKNWVTGYELFRFGWQQCPRRSEADLEGTLQFVNNIWAQINSDNTWEERLNVFCGYCQGRHKCKKYTDYLNDPKRGIDTIITDTTNWVSIKENHETLSAMEKILKGRVDELGDLMKTAIQQSALESKPFIVGDHELYLQAQSRPSYNFYQTRATLMVHGKANILDDCTSISKTKLDKAIKGDPLLKMELEKCLLQSYSAPYLMKRKAKK